MVVTREKILAEMEAIQKQVTAAQQLLLQADGALKFAQFVLKQLEDEPSKEETKE